MKEMAMFIRLGIAILLAIGLPATITAEIPEELASASDPQGPPAWISVARATAADGELSLGKFDPRHHKSLLFELPPHVERRLQEASDEFVRLEKPSPPTSEDFPCVVTTTPLFEEGVRPHGSLRDLVEESELIFTARIGRHETGFFDGRPVTLLSLTGLDLLKTSSRYNHDRLFLSYPQAKFRIGERGFCNERKSLPDLPSHGDEVLVFAYFPPKDLPGNVVEIHHFGFISTSGRELWLPFTLETDVEVHAAESLEEIVEQARAMVVGTAEP